MRINFEAHDDEWRHAAGALFELMRPPAPWTESVRRPSCEDVWTIGPVGDAWFEQGSRRVGYSGSLLYLACGLADWLHSGESYVIESESAYQSPDVEFKRTGGSFTITVRSVHRPEPLRVAPDELQRAAAAFLGTFGQAAIARIPGIQDVEGLDWLPK